MKQLHLMLAGFSLLIIPISGSFASPDKPCTANAVKALETHDPDGYAVYQAVGDEAFSLWLNCRTPPYGLSLAVHESVHRLSKSDSASRTYRLPGGGTASAPLKNLFFRSLIVSHLAPTDKDTYYSMYLTGPSGNQDIVMLLEEVNAYTYAAISDTKLVSLMPKNSKTTSRDGLASLMYYLELYLREARLHHKSDYNQIKGNEEFLPVIKTMWENAEDALLNTAPYLGLGVYDRYKLKQVYDPKNLQEIKLLYEGSANTIAFREEIPSLFRLNAGLAKGEVPEPDSADKLPPGATKTSVMQVTINGKTYTCQSLAAAAAGDANLAGLFGQLKSQGVCK